MPESTATNAASYTTPRDTIPFSAGADMKSAPLLRQLPASQDRRVLRATSCLCLV